MPPEPETVFQCDFDGTVTVKDVSFMLLDAFAEGDWRKVLKEYSDDKITVGEFNARVFAMVKASRETMLDYIKKRAELREGLPELAEACRRKNYRLVIVSNGLDFYIEQILTDAGLSNIEAHAARTVFTPRGIDVAYISPSGSVLMDGFKESYTRHFLKQGCRVIYAGNGYSDFAAAKLSHKVFAVEGLLDYCREVKFPCRAFEKLSDIAKEIEDD